MLPVVFVEFTAKVQDADGNTREIPVSTAIAGETCRVVYQAALAAIETECLKEGLTPVDFVGNINAYIEDPTYRSASLLKLARSIN